MLPSGGSRVYRHQGGDTTLSGVLAPGGTAGMRQNAPEIKDLSKPEPDRMKPI